MAIGAPADIILVDYDPPTPLTAGNLPWHVIFGLDGTGVDTTIVAGQVLSTIEPGDSFHTVTVEIPSGLATTPRRALLEFVSLAPRDHDGPRGIYIDRLRLRSVEPSDHGGRPRRP